VGDGLTALLHASSHDVSWLAQPLLFLLAFMHQDLAVLAGAYFLVNQMMAAVPVAVCIYAGIVASDLALYGVGAGARQLPWLRRIAIDGRMRDFAGLLDRDLFGLVAFGRAAPGIAFVGFIACGWVRVPFVRFIVASLSMSALYLPLILCLMVFFGSALQGQIGMWTWPALLGLVLAVGFVRRRVFGFGETAPAPARRPAQSRAFAVSARKPLPVRPVMRRPRWRPVKARATAGVVVGTAPTPN
jgi:membrane protein DedA with SNARE-associated domain